MQARTSSGRVATRPLAFILGTVAVAACFTFPPPARALITIGALAPPDPPATCDSGQFRMKLPSGDATGLYRVPVAGMIISWSTNGAASPMSQSLGFQVFRPLSGSRVLLLANGGGYSIAPRALNTFFVTVLVEPGDLIGLQEGPGAAACVFASQAGLGNNVLSISGQGVQGESVLVPSGPEQVDVRLNVSATLLQPPSISQITPASGPVAGLLRGRGSAFSPTRVLIRGSEFRRVKSVTFGTNRAQYTIDSDQVIAATVPPSRSPGSVSVTVTTAAGTAELENGFTYQSSGSYTCEVPRLRGIRLRAARTKLREHHCAIGEVIRRKHVSRGTGVVIRQSPRPGSIREVGTTVRLVLGHRKPGMAQSSWGSVPRLIAGATRSAKPRRPSG